MKTRLVLYILIIANICACTKKQGMVQYGQIESVGLKGPHGPDFNSLLFFDTDASYYVSAKDSLDSGTEFQRVYDNADGSHGLTYSVYTTSLGRQVYHNRKKDSMYSSQWNNFYLAEKTPKIDWKLEAETKQIGEFTANRATGKFRGRIYTAWYTTKIPVPFGPWKLQGLHGLILEAYDKDKEMYIYFKSIEYPAENPITITQIKRSKKHTKTWQSLDDFKLKLDKIYERMLYSSISIDNKIKKGIPKDQIKSEALLESF